MKKITVILVALLLICGMATLGLAQTSQATGTKKAEVCTEVIKGKIVSIDTVKNEIVIKEIKKGKEKGTEKTIAEKTTEKTTEKTIVVDPKVIASLKVDDEVEVTLKPGSNVAEKVKEIIKPVAPAKKSSKK